VTALSASLARFDAVSEHGCCSFRVAFDDGDFANGSVVEATVLCGPFPRALAAASAGRVLVGEAARALLALSVGTDAAERCASNERVELAPGVEVRCAPVQGCCVGTCDWVIAVDGAPVAVACGTRLRGTPAPMGSAPALVLFAPAAATASPAPPPATAYLVALPDALPRGLLAAFALRGANLNSLPAWAFAAKALFKRNGALPVLPAPPLLACASADVVFCLADEANLVPLPEGARAVAFSTLARDAGAYAAGDCLAVDLTWTADECDAAAAFARVVRGPAMPGGLQVGATAVLHAGAWVERAMAAVGDGRVRCGAAVEGGDDDECTVSLLPGKRVRVEAASAALARRVAARLRA